MRTTIVKLLNWSDDQISSLDKVNKNWTLTEDNKPLYRILTRKEMTQEIIGRICVCTDYRDWDGKPEGETVWHCNAKLCVHWNRCTLKYSIPYTRLDQLFKLIGIKGFCDCKSPKYHGDIQTYSLCLNDDCFKVLKEYQAVWEEVIKEYTG